MLSHAEHLQLPRDTPLKKTLFACDELSGFITACGRVRPDGIETLEPKSVRKKLKQPSFAAGVNREEVYRGAEELGVDARRAHRVLHRGDAADLDPAGTVTQRGLSEARASAVTWRPAGAGRSHRRPSTRR